MHQNYFDCKQEKLNLNKKGKKMLPEEYEVGLVPIRKVESIGTSRDLEFQGESLLAYPRSLFSIGTFLAWLEG